MALVDLDDSNQYNESKEPITDIDKITISIQIASDIHTEFNGVMNKMEQEDRFPQCHARILALLGDIGYPNTDTYWQFIDKMIDRFEYIIIITGNHEYYKNEYYSVHRLIHNKIESNVKYKNKVYFLHNKVLEIPHILPNIRILGSTMWVNYPKAEEDENIAIQYEYKVNDFRIIRINHNEKEELLTSVDVNRFHNESVKFIQNELNRAQNDNKKVIILSHHAPTNYKTIYKTKYANNPLGYGMNYASMEYMFRKPLIGWFFGHTHFNCDFLLKCNDEWTVRIASNQQGYIMGKYPERAPKDYSNHKVIIFPNNHQNNAIVPVIGFQDFKKHLIDKTTLIPDPAVISNIREQNKSVCDIL